MESLQKSSRRGRCSLPECEIVWRINFNVQPRIDRRSDGSLDSGRSSFKEHLPWDTPRVRSGRGAGTAASACTELQTRPQPQRSTGGCGSGAAPALPSSLPPHCLLTASSLPSSLLPRCVAGAVQPQGHCPRDSAQVGLEPGTAAALTLVQNRRVVSLGPAADIPWQVWKAPCVLAHQAPANGRWQKGQAEPRGSGELGYYSLQMLYRSSACRAGINHTVT